MTDLNDFFDPVSIDNPGFEHLSDQSGFPHNIKVHTENVSLGGMESYKIALLGVPEGRNSPASGSMKGPDSIRTELYKLAKIPGKLRITDLGNMKRGITFNDTVAGLTEILMMLAGCNVFPVILGGSSALALAVDRALSRQEIRYTLLAVDSRIDYVSEKKENDSFNYLSTIMHDSRSTFSHYINLGYQTYLNDQQVINRFNRRKSELIRIGDVRNAIHLTEPMFRDSDAVLLDISSVRQSDAPGCTAPSPNGFYGEEICLLARYAGISDNLKIFGLFDLDPDMDIRNQTAALCAQILWFFLEGFSQKQYETPHLSTANTGRFIRYHVKISDLEEDLIFVRSNLTERWWMEFQVPGSSPLYIACSHEDYIRASRDEVPERWVSGSKRLRP
ncbi:MAG: hypothetical protein GX876_04035 [Bacteroidales bacterium]|nr:hypothetical protein [Bacteroidales bacterium]